jgi:hypothetical protein
MEPAGFSSGRVGISLCICLLCALPAVSQQILQEPQIPPNFDFDLKTAIKLRSQLLPQSLPATGSYALGHLVFDRLLQQLPDSTKNFAWDIRIVDDDQFNAYSSPDGTIYVETGLARLAGRSAGLWAAILSHEIAHVVSRDWARRYLYQKSLEDGSAAGIVLGDPGLPAASWSAPQKASENLGRYCRQLEIQADRQGLMLMASAGFHPDFVPALHHLLHAQGSGVTPASLSAMHPCWEERDRELARAYTEASIAFDHRWPEWYASPGGNPPVVVFAEGPTVKKISSSAWEVQFHLRCQNLAGAVEVVLRTNSTSHESKKVSQALDPELEFRELTGCTSSRTTITFTITAPSDHSNASARWTDLYVFDAWGEVLARSEGPKLPAH